MTALQADDQSLKVLTKDAAGRVTGKAVQTARFVPLRPGTK
jgi:hypothetical protein